MYLYGLRMKCVTPQLAYTACNETRTNGGAWMTDAVIAIVRGSGEVAQKTSNASPAEVNRLLGQVMQESVMDQRIRYSAGRCITTKSPVPYDQR